MEIGINQVINNRYVIKEIIGVGGMSRVYKAYDRVDDRIVALKVLKDEYLENYEYTARFKNESRAISLLNHPNIVKVYDVCFDEDLHYFAMEHVEGITLKEFIQRQRVLDWKEALIVTVQILRALSHAHDKGVIHRDIKPQNILLLPNASIKVTDFGIASFKRGEIKSPVESSAIGSVHYVSPEQAQGNYTDEKSDIYSVGVVLYEMLTGKTPFDGQSDDAIAMMHVQREPVKPSVFNPEIPVGLEQICLRAMQKLSSNRYQSASEFLLDLDEFRKNPDIVFDYCYFIDKEPTKHISTKLPVAPVNEEEEYYDEEDEYEEESRNSFLPVLLGVAVSFVVVIGIVVFVVFGSSIGSTGNQFENVINKIDVFGIFSKDEIEVPNFINMNFEEILSKYPELAIENPPQYEYNSNYEDGHVCNQYPEAGDKVSKDTVLKLTVATSGEMVLVQDVTGKKSIEAESILKASGLVVELIPLIDDTREEGEVIYTEPIGNKYTSYNGTVYVYYATGKNDISSTRVPNVVGFELEAAKQKIIAAGLTVGAITQGASAPSLEGFVISQTPDAAISVNSGVNVNLVVGNGIPATNTAVFTISLPDLGSKTKGEIKTYLNDVAYDSIENVPLNGENYQLSFTGTEKENSFSIYCDAVLIYTGDIDFTTTPPTFSNVHGYQFSTKTSVPDVVGLKQSEAETALTEAGFKKIKVETESNAEVAAGLVISQSPLFSDTAKYSTLTVITLVVSEGDTEETTLAPDETTEPGEETSTKKPNKKPQETTTKKSQETTTKKTQETTTKKSQETTTKKTQETTTKKSQETTTKKPQETTTKKPEESTTKKPEESTTKKPEESTTKKPQETTTKNVQETTTEKAAETTEKLTEVSTEKPEAVATDSAEATTE